MEAHNLERRKTTDVLLFLLMDTDQTYNKDKPNAISVTYGLKGHSLNCETAQWMVTDIRNFLHHQNINVLVEVYGGQWSRLVFRDSNDKPLTLFELKHDCWLKFKIMSQEKLINFIESLCKNTKQNLQQWTAASLDMPESRHIGNIRATIKKHKKETRDVLHMQHCKTFLELESYCNEHNCEGGLKMVTFLDVATRPDVWEVHITDLNLLHLLQIKKYSRQRKQQTQYTYYDSESESSTPDMMESIVEDMECDDMDTDEIGLEHGHIVPNLSGIDSADIKHILLTTHHDICTEIIFLLLCGKRGVKWSSLDVESLLNDILCTPESIYKELTSYKIDGVLRVIQRCCTKKCPLVVKPKMKKLMKANFLGHVLGHYYRYIPPHKKVKDMPMLSAICRQEVVCSVPEDVMWVGLALWTLRYDLEDWLNSSPVPVTLQIPVEPHE